MKDKEDLNAAEQNLADALVQAQKNGKIRKMEASGFDADVHIGSPVYLDNIMKLQSQFDMLCEKSHAHTCVDYRNAQEDMVGKRLIVAKSVLVKTINALNKEQVENVSRALKSMAKFFTASSYLRGEGHWAELGIGGQMKHADYNQEPNLDFHPRGMHT